MIEPTKPQGELIDLWDVPLTAVSNPEHLKLVKGYIAFTRIAVNEGALDGG